MKLEERKRLVDYVYGSIDKIVYNHNCVESEREKLIGVLIFSHDFLKIIEGEEFNSIERRYVDIVDILLSYPEEKYYPVNLDKKINSLSENDRKEVKRLISQIMIYGEGRYKEESEDK